MICLPFIIVWLDATARKKRLWPWPDIRLSDYLSHPAYQETLQRSGADYFDQRDRGRIERHHIHRLEQLGYTVTPAPKEVA